MQTIPGLLGLQLGAHPRLDDGGFDGFGDVVGGAERQAVLFALEIGEGGEQHHRNAAGVGVDAQMLEHLVAFHAGHHHIQQDEIRPRLAARNTQALLPALGGEHPITGREQLGQHHQVLGRVIDDEDGGTVRCEHKPSVTLSR
ncbi:hypothetical protein D3C86_1482920 [compost metagenome]